MSESLFTDKDVERGAKAVTERSWVIDLSPNGPDWKVNHRGVAEKVLAAVLPAYAKRVRAEALREAAEGLDRIAAAAGYGPLADVVAHQERLGVTGRGKELQEKRITKLIELVIEASSFRDDGFRARADAEEGTE